MSWYWIDEKYLLMVSGQLENFKQVRSGLFNHTCPNCDDNHKKKTRARGYHYIVDNQYNYKCHNCGQSTTTANFIKNINSEVYKQYALERFTEGYTKSNYEKPTISKSEKPDFGDAICDPQQDTLLSRMLPTIHGLDDDHRAKKYLLDRKIPKEYMKDLYFLDDVTLLGKLNEKYLDKLKASKEKYGNEERILIPIRDEYGKLVAVTCRALEKENSLRYLTVRVNEDKPTIYGLDTVNKTKKIYAFEGPLDSMFIENSVATCGTNLKQLKSVFPANLPVLIYDNQPRNKELVKIIEESIDLGFPISFLPEISGSKDVNEMIVNGVSKETILSKINEKTYQGMRAKVEFMYWKKC